MIFCVFIPIVIVIIIVIVVVTVIVIVIFIDIVIVIAIFIVIVISLVCTYRIIASIMILLMKCTCFPIFILIAQAHSIPHGKFVVLLIYQNSEK